MSLEQPYLSVVATARNDDHGGNLLRRVQTFTNALIAQSNSHSLPMELVLVDWNPPSAKPPLADALSWPANSGFCRVRTVTVPPALHNTYRFGNNLPLYQMIGKNVGIRRADGEYILATNIDILFSDEMIAFLATRRLEPGRMYRVDRHDVEADVPVDAAVDERLRYCERHCIRVNTREGTFALTPEGHRKPGAIDLTTSGSGVFFGKGWYAPEQHFGRVFRWGGEECVVSVNPSGERRTMVIETQSGPGTRFAGFPLELRDADGRLLGSCHVHRRSTIRIQVPAGMKSFRLTVRNGGNRSESDARTLNFCALRCEWATVSPPDAPPIKAADAPPRIGTRGLQFAKHGIRFVRDWRVAKRGGRVGLPVPASILQRLQPRAEGAGISIALKRSSGDSEFPEVAPADLHTNACGDFTLAHRRHWMELRGYPELDLYSMNLDSLFCYMAHYGGAREEILEDPIRIYHIEHGSGSGWTPEGEERLFGRLAEKGVSWLPYRDVLSCAAMMARYRTTLIFNRENWGLGDVNLVEARPCREGSPAL